MKFFTYKEFDCPCCGTGSGKKNMNKKFLIFLEELRTRCSFPFVVSSGFRCKNKQQSLIDNPKYKASSPETSGHCKGLAADIIITDSKKRAIFIGHTIELTSHLDLPLRIGISGKQGFCHIDINEKRLSPRIWTYS
tara:strand:+ start:195 stop:602 length:408 start_codon:yes stop_codon:yes gene_type:complete